MKSENKKEIAEQSHEELETRVRHWRKLGGINIEINQKEGTEENYKNRNQKTNNGTKLESSRHKRKEGKSRYKRKKVNGNAYS